MKGLFVYSKLKTNWIVLQNVISPLRAPTEWCSDLVNAPKHDGDIRICCVDLTALNKAVMRERERERKRERDPFDEKCCEIVQQNIYQT